MDGSEPWDQDVSEVVAFAHRLLDLVRDGDPKALAYVDRGVPVDLSDADGNSLLMLAAYNGRPAIVRGLVERGADVDRLNDRGQSPLAGAVFKGEVEVVEALAVAGADPDAGSPTARETARMFDRDDLLTLLDAPPT